MHDPVRHIVVLGGGAAGWMFAAILAKVLKPEKIDIRLVEFDNIGIIAVDEATIAGIRSLNNILGARENTFVREAQATLNSGVDFLAGTATAPIITTPFGRYGVNLGGVDFQQWG